jgi:copper chaperone
MRCLLSVSGRGLVAPEVSLWSAPNQNGVAMSETFSVPEISCDHCKASIEKAVQPLGGVQSAVVDVASKTVTVDYDDSNLDRRSVINAIEEAGYSVSG